MILTKLLELVILLINIATYTPPLEDACVSVTNYWPYKWENNQWVATAYEGQADADPFHTAYMYEISAIDAGTFVAAPDSLGGKNIYLPGWGTLPVKDRFGAMAYREGVFYHHIYEQYVWGVDIFTPDPYHYLECDWEFR